MQPVANCSFARSDNQYLVGLQIEKFIPSGGEHPTSAPPNPPPAFAKKAKKVTFAPIAVPAPAPVTVDDDVPLVDYSDSGSDTGKCCRPSAAFCPPCIESNLGCVVCCTA